MNGVEPFAYLKATLEASRRPPQSRIDDLPWNFTQSGEFLWGANAAYAEDDIPDPHQMIQNC
ncbi:MAG: transposase domain-containing protein [Paracoccaceae bacterium]